MFDTRDITAGLPKDTERLLMPEGRSGLGLALQRDNLAKVVQPQQGRFSPVPGKADHRTRGSADVLDDVRLKDVFGHAKRLTLRVEVFLLR